MNASDAELARKKTLGFVWLCAVCFFNTVPLFVISVLANLNSVSSLFAYLHIYPEVLTLDFSSEHMFPFWKHGSTTLLSPLRSFLVSCPLLSLESLGSSYRL